MPQKYYFDTSIWLDLFEDRNESGMPKGKWISRAVEKVFQSGDTVVFSDVAARELEVYGYPSHAIQELIAPFGLLIEYHEGTDNQTRRAKDLAAKRGIPPADALHALVARDAGARMVTLDRHFLVLQDIVKIIRPFEIE